MGNSDTAVEQLNQILYIIFVSLSLGTEFVSLGTKPSSPFTHIDLVNQAPSSALLSGLTLFTQQFRG